MKKEHHSFKPKVINGISEEAEESNIVFLQDQIRLKQGTLTNKERLVFSYHFTLQNRNKDAIKYLNQIDGFYFTHDIYKDLYLSLLGWTMYNQTKDSRLNREHEFFLVVKRSIPNFKKLKFRAKSEYEEFSKNFIKNTVFMR